MSPPPGPRYRTPASRRYWILATAWLLLAFESAYLIVPASVLPVISAELALSPTLAGWVISAFFVGQLATSLPVGVVIDLRDRYVVTGVATVGLLVAGVLGWWAAATGSYPLLVGSRALGGVAGVTMVVALTNIVGSAFTAGREATAVGVFTAGGPAGIALGQVAGPHVAALLGWGAIFLVFPVGAVAAFGLLAVAGNQVGTAGDAGSTPTPGDFRTVLTNRGLWHVGAMSFIAYSVFFFLSSWMPSYLTETFGVSLAAGGLFLGAFTLGGVLARSGGGALSDQVFGARRRPVALLSFVTTTLLVAVIAGAESVGVVLAALVVAGVTGQLTNGLFFTHAREVVADDVTGVAVALFVTISVAGALTAPVLTGALIDYSNGYGLAFGYAVVLGGVAVALAWVAPEPNR